MARSWIRAAGVALAALVLTIAAPNRAAADYLTAANQSQLEAWLGQGDQTFTNIFSSRAGDGQTSSDFHAAVDGKGPTITLIRISAVRTYYGGTLVETVDQIIGGYNPQSWNSSASWNFASPDSQRSAFIFNLTTDSLLREQLSTDNPGAPDYGGNQTFNYPSYGPAFGGGFDLGMYSNLNEGYA